jgi:nucleotide-binding universal stress UspA family protein
VIVSPKQTAKDAARNIVIAWKPTAEAARAVDAAIPLLCRADKVTVAVATEDAADEAYAAHMASALATRLAWHGVKANPRVLGQSGSDPEEKIASLLGELRADFLVMGAYGHGRTRELIFGGFTRHMLQHTPVATLMAH